VNEPLCDLQQRIRVLEKRVLGLRSANVFLILLTILVAFGAFKSEAQPSAVVRARTLIIEDETGRDRVILGAPVPDPKEGKRNSPSYGMVINDVDGIERFGLGLQANGRMVMGFDAPPGTGDPRNRERINVVADETGGAYVRFVNRKTFVPGRLILDKEDQFYLEFLDFPAGKTISRRVSFKGDEKLEQKR